MLQCVQSDNVLFWKKKITSTRKIKVHLLMKTRTSGVYMHGSFRNIPVYMLIGVFWISKRRTVAVMEVSWCQWPGTLFGFFSGEKKLPSHPRTCCLFWTFLHRSKHLFSFTRSTMHSKRPTATRMDAWRYNIENIFNMGSRMSTVNTQLALFSSLEGTGEIPRACLLPPS